MLDLGVVVVFGGAHVAHRAAAGHVGHAVGEQLASGDEHAGGAGAADQLVRRDEHGVLVREVAVGVRAHVDRDVRGRSGVVPQRQRAVAVQQRGHRDGVGDDAGHVRRSRERTDQRRAVGVSDQLALEMVEAHVTVGVLVDDHDVGDRLAPGELVRVVLVGPDEHHGALVGGDGVSEVVAVVERRRELEAEHPDQLGDGVGGAAAAEHHGVFVVGGADAAADDPPGLLA